MLKAFPFMALVVGAYNVAVLVIGASLASMVGEFRLPSGAVWALTVGDVLVIGGLVALFVELVTAASSRTSSIVNHGLSMLVFVVCVVEFLLVAACGSSAFLFITLMTLVDVIAGYSVSIVAARRDFSYERSE